MVPLWKKWSKNREPDQERVEEMVARGGYIHLAELVGEGLVCYDGNHRREVLKRTSTCIVDVMFHATHDDAFVNINKGVEVPEIYMEDGDNILQEVTALVKTYETRHKPFISVSRAQLQPRRVHREHHEDLYVSSWTEDDPGDRGAPGAPEHRVRPGPHV